MIATAESYLQQIWRLYDGNVPQKAIILPEDEPIYEIDLNERTIKSPYSLGVKKDQAAETVYFVVDRFYNETDLANTACIVYYKNSEGEVGFYPVPFFDTTTFSSIITQRFIEVALNETNYVPNKFYIKDNEEFLLCTDEIFNTEKKYYQFNDTSINKKYERVNLSADKYQSGKFYIVDENLKFILDLRDNFDVNACYYIPMEKRYINSYVEYSNYKPNTYFIFDKNYELVLDKGPFNRDQTYYSILDKSKILFPWTIGNKATAATGELQFAIRFYKIQNYKDEAKLVYNLATKMATTQVLDSLEIEIKDDDFSGELIDPPDYWQFISPNATVLEDIYYKLNLAMSNNGGKLYWTEA